MATAAAKLKLTSRAKIGIKFVFQQLPFCFVASDRVPDPGTLSSTAEVSSFVPAGSLLELAAVVSVNCCVLQRN